MGGGQLGAFATGLSATLMQAQQRKTEQEYRKALIEQSKLATKKLENDLKLKEYGYQAIAALDSGQPLPPVPQLASAPAPQEIQKQGILGRMFNPQPPAPAQPAPIQPQTQAPIPQMIAQGQMQSQMPQGQQMSPEMRKARSQDLLYHQVYGVTPWREKALQEEGHVGQKVTVMTPQGPATLVISKSGQPMQMFNQPPEYGSIKKKGPYGEEYEEFYPKTHPPGYGGYGGGSGVMTSPPAQAMQKAPSGEEEKQLSDLEGKLGRLDSMIAFAKDPKNKDAFGSWATQKHAAYQDESITGGIARGVIENAPQSLGGGPPRPEVSSFLSDKQSFINQLRNKEFGSALSAREYSEFVKEAMSSTTPQQFVAVTSKVRERIGGEYERLNKSIQQPYGVRSKPSLKLNQSTPSPAQAEQMLIQKGYKRDAQGNWVK